MPLFIIIDKITLLALHNKHFSLIRWYSFRT